MNTVAVAVACANCNGRGNGSRRAVRWAAENLLPQADHFTLVHVMPIIAHVPNPSGERTPIKELDPTVVDTYMKDVRNNIEEMFARYKRVCKVDESQIETVILEDDNPATAILNYIAKTRVRSLVLGSHSTNFFWRKIRGRGVPSRIMKCSPDFCDIFVVSRNRVTTKLAASLITSEPAESIIVDDNSGQNKDQKGSSATAVSTPLLSSSSGEPEFLLRTPGRSPISETYGSSYSHLQQLGYIDDLKKHMSAINQLRSPTTSLHSSNTIVTTSSTDKFDLQSEVEKIKQELQVTLALYNEACDDLVHAQTKYETLSAEVAGEAEKINAASERELYQRKIATQEQARHLLAIKEAEEAKMLLAKEACERQIAEVTALQESSERQRFVDELILSTSHDTGYKRYSVVEIENATDHFSESKVIGEGSYGKVYKGYLDHTPVAIKVLQHDATEKKEEFLKEVGILRRLRHPNIVLLLGACPELGCLVYEYMEHGSLEDHIFSVDNIPPLPWFSRFQIAFEVACGLAFLHKSKPEPIVHRDLKPGNILLGRNFVSKISDVGLAKILSEAVPDAITQFAHSSLAGTLYYMDPEYQRTGTVRPKSDLYSFGIVLLQLLTGRHPNGLLMVMENAVESNSLRYMLDTSILDWPLNEAEELAGIALECCKLRCRDRPDLETQVLPILKKLADIADASKKVDKNSIYAPSHYFCPILKEIMYDPQIAADGYTYERKAIETWMEKHDVSPITNEKLQHFSLIPNNTLHSAIHDWRSRLSGSNT